VHVDEINRATPKLQSAFLEAMQEQSVTLSNQKLDLPIPFFVVATQNPYDGVGTYLLPYAQVDRFMVSVTIEPLTAGEEYALLQHADQVSLGLSIPDGNSVISGPVLMQAMRDVRAIAIEDTHIQYALSIVHTIKKYGIPLSTRASKSLIVAAKSRAYLQGKTIVESVDIDAVVLSVLGHRVSYSAGSEISAKTLYRLVT
jgi:MoxR-like ATPase